MFWKYNLVTDSNLETLLDKPNLTVKELLDEDEILQECKAETKKLIDFLIQPQILDEMITMLIEEPTEECNEALKYRYSNRVCELLTLDIAKINDALASNKDVLNKLYGFLKNGEPMNPLLAGFFIKTMGLLLLKKTEVMFYFVKERDFINLMLTHLDTSAIMDLLLRFATSVEKYKMRKIVIKWLDEEKLIQQLVSRIDMNFKEEIICNASFALRYLIKASRENMSFLQEDADLNPLLETVESVNVISELLNHMFNDTTKDTAIINGILVLLELLMFKKQGPGAVNHSPPDMSDCSLQDQNGPSCFMTLFQSTEAEPMTVLDAERLSQCIHNVLTAITPHLIDFHNLLLKPPRKSPITLTIGCLDPPLGLCRIEVAHLIAALLSTNYHEINVKLASFKTVNVLMDMFFEYPWNNFLHTHVEHAVGRIITNVPTMDVEGNKVHPLLVQMLTEYKITNKIMDNFEEKPAKGGKKGFGAHLTKIANKIAKNFVGCINSNLIQRKLKELPEERQKQWYTFVHQTLAERNEKNSLKPPFGTTLLISPVNKESPFRIGLVFPDDSVEEFSLHADEFDDPDDSLINSRNALNPFSQNFSITEGRVLRSSEIYQGVCPVAMDPDEDAILWADRNSSPNFSKYFQMSNESTENDSNDSGDECQVFDPESNQTGFSSEEMKMDVDNQNSLLMKFDPAGIRVEMGVPKIGWKDSWAEMPNFDTFGASTSDDSESVESIVAYVTALMESEERRFQNTVLNSESSSDSCELSPEPEQSDVETCSSEKQNILKDFFDEET